MEARSSSAAVETLPSRRPARRERMRTAVLAAVACASLGVFLPGVESLQTGWISSLGRYHNAGSSTIFYGGASSGPCNRRNRREMREDTFATQQASRRGGPLYVGDFLKGDLYPGFPRPGLSLIKRIANDGKSKKGEGSGNGDNDDDDASNIAVTIERPSMNSRKISASIIVKRPVTDVWAILTDYNRLAVHVPNLVQSKVTGPSAAAKSNPSSNQGVRLFQEGAQKIVGFDFSASLTMDMNEELEIAVSAKPTRSIGFKLVESQFFSEFDGAWTLSSLAHANNSPSTAGDSHGGGERTKLTYEVFLRPNGPVPVVALEWRIKADVPTNLVAVKKAAESLRPRIDGVLYDASGHPIGNKRPMTSSPLVPLKTPALLGQAGAVPTAASGGVGWESGETLGGYLSDH